jgi:Uma2 family endonuclease
MGTAALIPALTAAEFLIWEEAQTEHHMFVRGEVFAMSGGTAEHNEATLNTAVALKQHLKCTSCKVFVQDMRLRAKAADYYYPDVLVTCVAADINDPKRSTLTGAKVIIEVISPSTTAFDRGDEFADYRTLEALEEYVLINPDNKCVDVFRESPDGLWVLHPGNSAAPDVRLESGGWVGAVSDLLGVV